MKKEVWCLIIFVSLFLLFHSCKKTAFKAKTLDPTDIMANRATFYGTFREWVEDKVIEKGFYYGTTPNPDEDDSKVLAKVVVVEGSAKVEGLHERTTYYVRAFSKLKNGAIIYGNEIQFETNNTYRFGDPAPGGGVVFRSLYAPNSTSIINYEAILAPIDSLQWGCEGLSISDTISYWASGLVSTTAIVAQCTQTNFAAKYCYNLNLNGFSNWYLPERYELQIIHTTGLSNKLNFPKNVYWSSTQVDADKAYSIDFNNGLVLQQKKSKSCKIILVREF